MSDINICQLPDAEVGMWNEYVNLHVEATFFHLAEWRDIFQKTLGHQTYYLQATINNNVVGVFPLVHIKSKLFGSALISIPFGVYGGVLANDAQINAALIQHAVELP